MIFAYVYLIFVVQPTSIQTTSIVRRTSSVELTPMLNVIFRQFISNIHPKVYKSSPWFLVKDVNFSHLHLYLCCSPSARQQARVISAGIDADECFVR